MLVGFVGNVLFGQFVNPPTTAVAVAIVEIPAGTVVTRDMLGIDDMRLNRDVAAVLVQESDLSQFVGGTAVEPIHAFQPVAKASIVTDGNPAAGDRLSLTLTDPDLVAMVVPVNRETSPQNLAVGDHVDLNFGVGSASFLAGTLSTAPTPLPFQPLPGVFVTPPVLPGVATSTPTPEPQITLPIAKTIVHAARVLSVVYDEAPNPAYAGPSSDAPATIRGDILAIVVTMPRQAEEIVHFAIVNGSIRVALLAPTQDWGAGDSQREPTLGMSWDDMVALFRLERDQALADGEPQVLYGPGAAAVKATKDAATQAAGNPTLSPFIVPTAQPTSTPTP